ncbi:MAG TPA: erythromycin esterase family protein, partial [Thermoanaerobaculia bacterium]|nr:erythromycin esterase family protein [Thermoanaerobaculia bacterium]
MRRAVFLLVFCLLALVSPAGAEAPGPYLDLDFELPECSVFWAAQGFINLPFEHAFDPSQAQSGRQSLRVRHLGSSPFNPQAGGPFLLQPIDAVAVAGRRVQLGGYIRTEGMTVGYAGLFVAASGPSGTVFAQLPAGSAATGSSPWSRYEVEADLPADITSVSVGLEMAGNGTAWFDNLGIQVDGRPLKQAPATSLAGPPPGHANWLRQRVTPLDSVLAGSGFADLQPLKQAIGDARIVSLGEGTHGTREFFQMKHRLFEFLVEEMGFTHFALEAGMPEADRINNYVLYGIGDPAELVEGMRFWIWNTQEVLDLVLWMRQYNASGKGPVRFAGFDMQFSWIAANNLYSFLRQAEPAYAAEALPILNQLIRVELTRRATPADLAAARRFYDRIVDKRTEYLALGYSAERVDWMIQNARILVQFCEVTSAGLSAAIVRDRFLAENTAWILDRAP